MYVKVNFKYFLEPRGSFVRKKPASEVEYIRMSYFLYLYHFANLISPIPAAITKRAIAIKMGLIK